MVYTAVEIVFFLIVAAVLGLVLGWLLRGKSIRERLESQWRRLLDDERNNHRQTHDQLKRVKAENETLGENAKGLQAKIEKLERLPGEKLRLEKQLEELQGQLAKLEPVAGEHAQLSAERGELQARIDQLLPLQGENTELSAKLKTLQTQLAELETVRGENAQLKAQIDALGPLRDQIQGLRDKRESTEAQVQELNPLRAENQQLRDTVASLRKSLAQAQEGQTSAGTGASEPAPEAPPEALQGTPSAEDLHVRVKRIAERTSGGESAADDDLKQIRGVGPVIEKMLKAMGITSYRQIANFTNEDIDQVTAAMDSFRGRIRRDSWIDGAREEYRKKYGSDA